MGVIELFTNKKKTEENKVEITAPAFSITKVATAFGAVAGAVFLVVPEKLKDDPNVVVASIAAATVIVLGVFALVAVDIRTRQRAQEANRRWPADEGDEAPEADTRVFEVGPGETLPLILSGRKN